MVSADQVRVFLKVVDEGSFSAAARHMRRRQSAISYAIATLEDQLGVKLFDRSGNRPVLTPAGMALLPDARKAAYNLEVMRDRGQAFARGVEAELAITIDTFCPLGPLMAAMADFAIEFPMVRPHIHLELVHKALALVLDGVCSLGIIAHPLSSREEFDQFPLPDKIELRPYVAPSHPLARTGRLENEELDSHIQFILGDRDGLSAGQEMAIFTSRTWTTSDLRAQQAAIVGGIGWGFLPRHLAADDLAAGRIIPLELAIWPDAGVAHFSIMAVRHKDIALGPAANWLLQRLIGIRS